MYVTFVESELGQTRGPRISIPATATSAQTAHLGIDGRSPLAPALAAPRLSGLRVGRFGAGGGGGGGNWGTAT